MESPRDMIGMAEAALMGVGGEANATDGPIQRRDAATTGRRRRGGPVAAGFLGILLLLFGLGMVARVQYPMASIAGAGTPMPLHTSGWQPGDPANLALLEGRLAVTSGGCLFLAGDEGSVLAAGIVWPKGFSARYSSGHQVEVVGATGRVIAHQGDLVRLPGGFGPGKSALCPGVPAGGTAEDEYYVEGLVQ
jgi:hypothetical protein